MHYHNITKCDMKNGDGLRTVLWLAGCIHHCKNCHNPITWDPNGGLEFGDAEKEEIFESLKDSFIDGITFSGGDPLHEANITGVLSLAKDIKEKFPKKNIWLYTGYEWEELLKKINSGDKVLEELLKYIDVLVDGRFNEDKKDVNYHWAGSTNQRVIDVQKTLNNPKGGVVLYDNY